jgi:hypothetical protein
MIEMPVNFIKTERTAFPKITRQLDCATLFIGCMKAIEETGTPGYVVMPGGVIREISGVKVTVTQPATEA